MRFRKIEPMEPGDMDEGDTLVVVTSFAFAIAVAGGGLWALAKLLLAGLKP